MGSWAWLGTLASALSRRVAPSGRRLPAREAYALWADSYPPWPHNPLMHAEQKVVAQIIASMSPTRALDVGTGSGRYLPLLAATGARLVVGLDFSMPMLTSRSGSRGASASLANPHHEGTDARATGARVCGDACRLPFRDACFELVSASLMVGDVADFTGWIGEMARVLAPGGHLIYSDFHPIWTTADWRRTFRTADGRMVEIPYFPHTVAEHVTRLEERRFDISLIQEQGLADEQAAGVSEKHQPVVVVIHAVKRASPPHAGPPLSGRARRG
jgi:malonyl-CoA O-methyltransferase